MFPYQQKKRIKSLRSGTLSKEIENKTCSCCDSEYRLVYTLGDTSGYPKFCPFCGADAYDDESEENDRDEE